MIIVSTNERSKRDAWRWTRVNPWIKRCSRRIREVDDGFADDEAVTLAHELYRFERTRAMAPEAAVDFVVAELARPDPQRFERRSPSRLATQSGARP